MTEIVSCGEYMLKVSWEEVQYSEGAVTEEVPNQFDRQRACRKTFASIMGLFAY